MGKTSIESRFNIPGKIGWATMEAPGFMTLLYIMVTLPARNGIERLPMANWVMAGLFVCLVWACLWHTSSPLLMTTYQA